MLKRVTFGPWLPDLAPTEGNVSSVTNLYPIGNGWSPAGAFSPITPSLGEAFRGGAAFVSSEGVAALLVGSANKLFRYSGGAYSIVLTALSADRWRFSQFGDLVVAVNGGAPVKFDLLTGSGGTLDGNPPASGLVATVRDFVWLAGDPQDRITLSMSAFNNAEGWTNGTDQATFQTFADGGEIMGLAGGEYGLVFQRYAIKRGTYVGGETIWQFDEISSNIGCMAKGSIAQAGRLVFFLSERGFMVTEGNDVSPIGAEKVDRWLFSNFSRQQIEGLWSAVDPRRTLVLWSLPGTPGPILIYNWQLERWGLLRVNLSGIFSGFTANVSLEAIDTLYPGGIDTVPFSLDDQRFAGGNPLLLVASADNVVGSLSGPSMAASVETADLEPLPGRMTRVREARPVTDAIPGSISIDARRRAGDDERVTVASDVRPSGTVPIRVQGRHMHVTHSVPAGAVWSYTQGCDLEVEVGGRR